LICDTDGIGRHVSRMTSRKQRIAVINNKFIICGKSLCQSIVMLDVTLGAVLGRHQRAALYTRLE